MVVCVACAWVSESPVVPRHGGHPRGDHVWGRVFLAALACAFVAYLLGLWLLRRGGGLRGVAALAAAIQLAPLAAPLLLSTDAWTYWAYAENDNPYRDTPAQADSWRYTGTAWRDYTSVYGPAFSLATEPVGATRSPDVAAWTFKVVAALSVLVCTAVAARRSRRPAVATAFVGWNPLLAVHFAGGGHNDALMMALVSVALALGDRGRRSLAGVAWALGLLVKWVAVLLLPLRGLEARATGRRVGHLAFALTVAVVLALATAAYRLEWVQFLAPLARNANRETSYAIPHRLGLGEWWGVLLVPFALAYAWLLRDAARGRARLGLTMGLFLLAIPYLAAWYAIWTVPLAAGDDDRAGQALALALCAYLLPQTIPT